MTVSLTPALSQRARGTRYRCASFMLSMTRTIAKFRDLPNGRENFGTGGKSLAHTLKEWQQAAAPLVILQLLEILK